MVEERTIAHAAGEKVEETGCGGGGAEWDDAGGPFFFVCICAGDGTVVVVVVLPAAAVFLLLAAAWRGERCRFALVTGMLVAPPLLQMLPRYLMRIAFSAADTAMAASALLAPS